MNYIRNATLDEQKGLVFLIQHTLHCHTTKGYMDWYNRTAADDSGFWHDRGFHYQPVVWMFRFNARNFVSFDRFKIRPNTQEIRDLLDMLCATQDKW